MKKLILGFVAMLFSFALVHAQTNPISWSFTSKKISSNTYEIHVTATPKTGWHIYSQSQPEDAIAIPTEIKFKKNPLFDLVGKVKEVGEMEKYHDAAVDVSAYQYSHKTDFVQTIKLKGKAKTKVMGSVTWQTCDNIKCLPPETVNFAITLK